MKFDSRTILGLLLFALASSSCQTVPDEPVTLSESTRRHFGPCANLDGALSLAMSRDNQLLGTTNMEWISDEGGALAAEVTNPLGQALLSLSVKNKRVSTSGDLADRLPRLTIADDGFLLLDEHYTGVHSDELPCLLAGRLPARWLIYVYETRKRATTTRVSMYDGERTIRTSIVGNQGKRICTKIRWRRYAGLVKSGFDWCISNTGRKRMTLSGLHGYELKWTDLDG